MKGAGNVPDRVLSHYEFLYKLKHFPMKKTSNLSLYFLPLKIQNYSRRHITVHTKVTY